VASPPTAVVPLLAVDAMVDALSDLEARVSAMDAEDAAFEAGDWLYDRDFDTWFRFIDGRTEVRRGPLGEALDGRKPGLGGRT
jgi:hypothetical protein